MTRIFIPRDAAALACGANKVATALQAKLGADVEVVRTGTRGLLWLEPMVEVETPAGRIAYGPVKPADLDGLLAAGFLEGGDH
ncbi:MAG: formate dehydrogenase, partial [Beijerinckiaceae bacterium]|nr:formate dehydrogenase [Beijerinckiaceae bacterium]